MEVVIQTAETGKDKPASDQKPAADPRPEHIPEKFWKDGKVDVEAMAKSYSELEKKQGTAEKKPDAAQVLDPKLAVEAATKAGFDLKTLSKEYVENGGKLTDATVAALREKGIPKDAIDNYVAGVQAASKEIVAEITKTAGSAEKVKSIYDWAAANLSKEEIEGYNTIMDAGNKVASKMAFEGLLGRYTAAVGKDGTPISGASGQGKPAVEPFASNAQVIAAMSDPRYKNGDAAYIKSVEARMRVTNIFGKGR